MDPLLHFAGAWAHLDNSLQARLGDAVDADVTVRERAWARLLADDDTLALTLALDLAVQNFAAMRMGSRIELGREALHEAARRVLERAPVDGYDRAGQALPAASHIVALLTLGHVGRPHDSGAIAIAAESRSAATNAWLSAWIAAARRALIEAEPMDAVPLIKYLNDVALDPALAEYIRCEAVEAIAQAPDSIAIQALRHVFESAADDVKLSAVCALLASDRLHSAEIEFIRSTLTAARPSGVLSLYRQQLVDALAQEGIDPTERQP